MDRLTTDNIKFADKIKSDLETPVDSSTKIILTIFPALPYDRYSIHYIKSTSPYLNVKTWDSKTDNQKFQLGIYNLDFLSIHQNQIPLTSDQVSEIDKLVSGDLNIDKLDGIILDGCYYFLKIINGTKGKTLEWRDKKQLSADLTIIFDKLCALANL